MLTKSDPIHALNPGDTVFLKERKTIFLGKWGGTCWFSFHDEDEVRGLNRRSFERNLT